MANEAHTEQNLNIDAAVMNEEGTRGRGREQARSITGRNGGNMPGSDHQDRFPADRGTSQNRPPAAAMRAVGVYDRPRRPRTGMIGFLLAVVVALILFLYPKSAPAEAPFISALTSAGFDWRLQ